MKQLPLFLNLDGRNVVLVGDGEAAQAKRRLIERAGGICVPDCPREICQCARVAFVALDDEDEAIEQAGRLRAKGMIVNAVDRPAHCDFTTPAIIDRDPILIAISTGGTSAGLAKALRQRLEALMPQTLGKLALSMDNARAAIKARWDTPDARRRQIDAAFAPGGVLDPFSEISDGNVANWIDGGGLMAEEDKIIVVDLHSNDPEDLTLRTARLLGEADSIFYDSAVAASILTRARADAARHPGPPPSTAPAGVSLYLRFNNDITLV
jgi:uroporphyrin-III C-methyltransferase / precorrin-2 dehydrogenase / sirohydrochlorin ferrochelatase